MSILQKIKDGITQELPLMLKGTYKFLDHMEEEKHEIYPAPKATGIIPDPQAFEAAVEVVLKNEGGLSENLRDPGGITKYGISLRLLQSLPLDRLKTYGFQVDDSSAIEPNHVRSLTIEQAKAIYYGEFWAKAPFAQIHQQEVINTIFDMAVNMGLANAIKCIQRACWAVFMNPGLVKEDGLLGENTLYVVNEAGVELVAALRCERAAYYRQCCASNPTLEVFKNGWLYRAYRT